MRGCRRSCGGQNNNPGCLASAAFFFALGVVLGLCCSYGTILVLLSLFLIGMVLYNLFTS